MVINVFCFIFWKYDKVEYSYFKELDMLVFLVDGMNEGGEGMNVGVVVGKWGINE